MKTQIAIALLFSAMAAGSQFPEVDVGEGRTTTGNDEWSWLDAWSASSASSPLATTTSIAAIEAPEVHSRVRRAVDLRTLRRLMTNIALSEFYRLRGLEVLGSLGMGHGKPGGIPSGLATTVAAVAENDDQETSASASAPKASKSGSNIFNFPLRPDEFQQFFGSLGRGHFAKRG